MSAFSQLKSRVTRAETVLLLLLAVLAGLLVWRYASHTATLLAYPYEWDEDEGYHVYFAKCLLSGRPIYGDINQLPFLPQTYPPVHAAILAPFVWIFGPTLFAGRLVSLLAIAGLSLLVLVAVRQETGRSSLGLLAAALIIGSPYITVWGPLCRVDPLMLFFLFAGLLVIRQYPRSPAALFPGLLLLLLACYTKQQAVFLVPAAFVHLWRNNRKTAILSFAGFALSGLLVLAVLQAWSGGSFWLNTVTGQATEFHFNLIIMRTKDFLNLHCLLAAGAVAWVVWQIRRRDLGLWSAFALSTVALMVLSGKNGASFNYYIPAVVAAAVCTALAVDRLWRSLPPGWLPAAAHMLVLPLLLQILVFWFEPIPEPAASDRQAADKILNLVHQSNGDILTERRVMFSVLANRLPQADFCLLYFLYYQDLERAQAASPPGSYRRRWNPQAMVAAIRKHRFSLLIIEPKFIPEEVWTEIKARYQPLKDQTAYLRTWHGGNAYQLCVPKKD